MDRWAEEKHSFLKRIKQQKLSRAIAVWWLKADFLLLVDSPQWWNKVLQYSSEHYRKICCLDWETRQESLVVYCPTGARGRPLPWREFSGDDTFLPVSARSPRPVTLSVPSWDMATQGPAKPPSSSWDQAENQRALKGSVFSNLNIPGIKLKLGQYLRQTLVFSHLMRSHQATLHLTLIPLHLMSVKMKFLGPIKLYHLKPPHGSASWSIQPGY